MPSIVSIEKCHLILASIWFAITQEYLLFILIHSFIDNYFWLYWSSYVHVFKLRGLYVLYCFEFKMKLKIFYVYYVRLLRRYLQNKIFHNLYVLHIPLACLKKRNLKNEYRKTLKNAKKVMYSIFIDTKVLYIYTVENK